MGISSNYLVQKVAGVDLFYCLNTPAFEINSSILGKLYSVGSESPIGHISTENTLTDVIKNSVDYSEFETNPYIEQVIATSGSYKLITKYWFDTGAKYQVREIEIIIKNGSSVITTIRRTKSIDNQPNAQYYQKYPFIAIDEANHVATAFTFDNFFQNNSLGITQFMGVQTSSVSYEKTDLYNALVALGFTYYVPPFSYKPLYNLHSSTQNFTLTTIGKTPNDGSPQIVAPISDIIAFSEQSRLRAYIQNIKDNDRFVKMFTLDDHKYIGIKIDTYTNGVYEGKIGFYIDGVRQEALNLNFLSNSIFDANNLFPYFLAISVDYDNGVCLPTIVYDWSDTGLTDYQCENYTAVTELYEYLHPFFGTVINPENPDIPVIDPTPTTDSETGGDGSWWTPDYEVGVPEIYEYGVADCGFMSLYRMTEAQMRNLASYLWSDDFLDNVKKFFNDPMQMIVCARMIPYTPNSAQNTSTIKAGNVDTTCVGYKIDSNNQYTKIDCGQVRVEPRGDTYMDYSPYCSSSIYLPFVGVRPLDVDLIMGHDIGVEYNCDCLTGQSVCFVKIDKNVAYSYECTIGTDIPISSQSYGNVIGALSSALTMPISAGTMLATGGMSAPMMPTMLASASIGVAAGTSIAQNTRETISHSGNVTGIGGMLSYKKPILYMEYTNPINAKNQKHFLGAPAHKNMVLKNCNGLTIVKQIFIELEEATDDEKKELSSILESGVIV